MSSSRWLKRLAVRRRQIAEFAVDLVYDRRTRGPAVVVVGGVMQVLSWVFGGVVRARLWLYEQRILRNTHLATQVVVVGNLTVGGTGKTPIVEKLARSLAERGRHVAILSRGYMSKSEPFYRGWWRWLTHGEAPPPKVVSDGKNVLLDSAEAGDEPYMLARNLPGVVVLVDKNRVKAGNYAVKKFGSDTLILDDGFQYLPLRGQLNLLLVDKTNPFGNGSLLPRGILREPVSHLRRASHVFITKSDGALDPALLASIRRHKPDAEIIECAHRTKFLESTNGHGRLELSGLRGKHVAAFSGIAMPESFENHLRELGAEIRHCQRFLDHHRFTEDELERFYARAAESGAELIVTTEKDAVRLTGAVAPSLPLYYLRLEIEILGGGDFDSAVSRICFPRGSLRPTRSPFQPEPELYAEE